MAGNGKFVISGKLLAPKFSHPCPIISPNKKSRNDADPKPNTPKLANDIDHLQGKQFLKISVINIYDNTGKIILPAKELPKEPKKKSNKPENHKEIYGKNLNSDPMSS